MIDCDVVIRKQKQGIKVTVKPTNGVKLPAQVFRREEDIFAYLRGFLKRSN